MLPLYLVDNNFKDSGIKSVIETTNITPDAKARLEQINLFIFFTFKKIKIVPIIVEKPAIKVNKKDIVILSIIPPIKYMKNLIINDFQN